MAVLVLVRRELAARRAAGLGFDQAWPEALAAAVAPGGRVHSAAT